MILNSNLTWRCIKPQMVRILYDPPISCYEAPRSGIRSAQTRVRRFQTDKFHLFEYITSRHSLRLVF